jgi:hypothetical protein
MARIRITKSAEQNSVFVSNTSVSAHVPIDGDFHDIHDDLLPVLDDSAVEYEVEATAPAVPKQKRPAAKTGARRAGGAAALGGSAAPPKRKRVRKSRAKAKI